MPNTQVRANSQQIVVFPRLRAVYSWRYCVIFILSVEMFLTAHVNTAELRHPYVTLRLGSIARTLRKEDFVIVECLDKR